MIKKSVVFMSFMDSIVLNTIQLKFGKEFTIGPNSKIMKQFKTYPYPKEVGYWFVKDNDLHVVMNNGEDFK